MAGGIRAIADAGFHAVAPDMRGLGRSSSPADVCSYSILDLVGDVVGLVQALGESNAIVVGHDWGAHVAWHAALLRPDMFDGVVGLSIPPSRRPEGPPLEMLRRQGIETFYWQYFQEPGVAEAEFERDVDLTRRTIVVGKRLRLVLPRNSGFLGDNPERVPLPAWFTQSDLNHMVETFRRTGFRGGLNWYRNIDRNWRLTAPWCDAVIRQPALFMVGSKDGTIKGPVGERRFKDMQTMLPNLMKTVVLDGAGHWIQRERASDVSEALILFLEHYRKALVPLVQRRL